MLLGSQRRGLRSINMPKAAAVTAILLGLAPLVAKADMETALKVEGWCKPVADENYSAQTPHVDLCWGAFAALLALSAVFCIVAGAMRREVIFGPALTHWDEAAVYAIFFHVARTLV